jgi:hypothetical protein
MSLGERLNNAIVQLDWVFPAKPEGTRKAVADLAQHWIAWWDSAERRALSAAGPTGAAAMHAKLERYAAWYARAYALAPTKVQAKVRHPRDLDVSVLATVEDQLNQLAEGAQAAAAAGGKVATFAAEQAKALREEIGEGLAFARNSMMALFGFGIAGLLAFGWMEKQRRGY